MLPSGELIKEATALARALGIEWPRNVLRHSFISYRIAVVKSADQVALEAGNSPSIIFKHYRELTTEDQADEWFGILLLRNCLADIPFRGQVNCAGNRIFSMPGLPGRRRKS